jgi:hypothetical protein
MVNGNYNVHSFPFVMYLVHIFVLELVKIYEEKWFKTHASPKDFNKFKEFIKVGFFKKYLYYI